MKQRFIVKWNNGYWKVFDSVDFSDVGIYKLKTEAELACAKMQK